MTLVYSKHPDIIRTFTENVVVTCVDECCEYSEDRATHIKPLQRSQRLLHVSTLRQFHSVVHVGLEFSIPQHPHPRWLFVFTWRPSITSPVQVSAVALEMANRTSVSSFLPFGSNLDTPVSRPLVPPLNTNAAGSNGHLSGLFFFMLLSKSAECDGGPRSFLRLKASRRTSWEHAASVQGLLGPETPSKFGVFVLKFDTQEQ